MNAGIDYGLGRSNIDVSTGIRYGVISQNSVSGESLNELEPVYPDPTCPRCGDPVLAPEQDERCKKDFYCVDCDRSYFGDECYAQEASGQKYDKEGYKLTNCLDNELFVLLSPYYTHARFCSPCVPGAGNLDCADPEGVKTYCLGHDWFEGGRAPYPVFEVIGDAQVHVSYAAEVVADPSGRFIGNALRFATRAEAEEYAAEKKRVWTEVTQTRVVETPDAVNRQFTEGRWKRIEKPE